MDFATWYAAEWVDHMYASGKLHGQIKLILGAIGGLFLANMTLLGLIIGRMAT